MFQQIIVAKVIPLEGSNFDFSKSFKEKDKDSNY